MKALACPGRRVGSLGRAGCLKSGLEASPVRCTCVCIVSEHVYVRACVCVM